MNQTHYNVGFLLTKKRGHMNSTEAAEINVPRMLNAMEFMINMSTKGIHLDCLGFVFNRFENTNGQILTQRFFNDNDRSYLKTDYNYKSQPTIKTTFTGQIDALAYCGTRCMGNIRGFKSNLISYDYRSKEFAIKVEDHNNPIFTVTNKIEPGNIPTDHINDINDEAEMFQYSLTRPAITDIVFDTARRMMQLVQISEHVDAMDFRMSSVIIDLELKDLEEEFKRKQSSFQNF